MVEAQKHQSQPKICWTKEARLTYGIKTLQSLKDTAGMPLIKGQRKFFIVGCLVSALSILTISRLLLERSDLPYECILTYRFSQDQLEMNFAQIRSHFDWNNNPTALQFKHALRALFLKSKIESPPTANCINVTDSEFPMKSPKLIVMFLSSLYLATHGRLMHSTIFLAALQKRL